MTWMCGVRPGSFTVCPGYARGDPLGIPGKFKEIDETLLWNRVTFFRTEEGIGCKVEFIYLKLSRDPYTRKLIEGRRAFTFPPSTNSHRPELDFSQLLLCLAFERGLFYYETPEELFNGNEKTLRKVPKIDQRPGFLKSDQGRALQQTEGMKESSLNPFGNAFLKRKPGVLRPMRTSCHSRIRWLSIQPFTDNKTHPMLQWRSNLRIL
jgi:hypothetical protein